MAVHRAGLYTIQVAQTGKRFPSGRCTLPEKVFCIRRIGMPYAGRGGDGQAVLTMLLGFVELVVDATGGNAEKFGRARLIAMRPMQRGSKQ